MTSKTNLEQLPAGASSQSWWMRVGLALLVGLILFVSFYNLTEYPTTWFDEGSHLHVPKTLVKFGVYADYSSEGFRYYGPTMGVGPTVILPLTAVFRLFGIGLLQARLVMALYLVATLFAFYRLAKLLGSPQMAVVATLLLVVTPGVALLEYGRQVLGEVPGFFFLLVALGLWLSSWQESGWPRLIIVGLLLGLAITTKSQYLLVVVPSLGLMWFLNLLYYRLTPQRLFLVPGIVAVGCAALWQAILVLYLGPSTALENFAILRQASAGAAFVFSTDLMRRSVGELLSAKVYLGALIPVLVYGFWLSLPRHRHSQRWSVVYILIVVNLLWYIAASISWIRYAFLGLALMSLLVAQFFDDLTDHFRLATLARLLPFATQKVPSAQDLIRGSAVIWLACMLMLPALQVARHILMPDFNAPRAMATYLDEHISKTALIETWEPEMGFLTDHNYHFPPAELLDKAVGYIWRNGSPPAVDYNLATGELPDYVLVGGFSRWVNLYPTELLSSRYEIVTQIDEYELFMIRQP